MVASVNGSGVVSISIAYIDNSGNLLSTNDGRVSVFAFTKRSGTPGTLTPAANLFSEISLLNFMPGSDLPFGTVQQIVNNILESLLAVEFFGPTAHANGDTIPLPTSAVDGYAYSRSELQYLWVWSDTTNQTGTHLRLPAFYGKIDDTTGVVTLHVFRLPPGGGIVEDNDTLCRVSVLTVARRNAHAAASLAAPTVAPQSDVSTGGNQVFDVPTLSALVIVPIATGALNGSNTAFTIASSATVVGVIWNGVLSNKFTQSSPPSTSFSTTFTPNSGDDLYALVST
jgi:hypothetical protein